jgi:rhomboid protease GluP
VLPADLPQSAPWVTYSLLGITILVFLAQAGTEFLLGFDLPALLGMKVNEWIAAGELWRLFTPMLLHGGILHIAFNMYALGVIGPELERFYGHGRFFLLYVLAGFAGNVFSLTFTDANSLGASTAIFGLLGAQGVFIYQNRALFGARAQAALGRIVQLAVINLLIGLQPGIDNWGHIGGLVGGAAFAWVAGPLMVWQGILPYVRLADRRAPGRALLAAAGIGLLFALLAAGVILFRV